MEKQEVLDNFARQLKEWREANGLSQREFCRMLGISRSAFNNYELGKNFPSIEIASKLAEITGLDVPTKLRARINELQGLGRQIAEWRIENVISRKELSKMLDIPLNTLKSYENGYSLPSKDIAVKLAEIICIDVPYSRSRARNLNEPLTDDERRFAELHHGLIYAFLEFRKIPAYDWYDIVAVEYLKAVKKWFACNDLHVYSFSTIAWNCMRTAVGNEIKRQKRHIVVSLDDVIPNTNGFTYGDILCDPRDCVGI